MRANIHDSRTKPVENLNPNPAFRRVSTGTTVVRKNLAQNPRFERVNSATTFFRRNLYHNPTPNRSTDGYGAVRMSLTYDAAGLIRYAVTDTNSAANSQRWGVYPGNTGTTNGAPCTPGRTYTISADVKLQRGHLVRVVGLQNPGNGFGTVSGAYNIAVSAGVWQRLSVTFVAPAGAQRIGIEMGFWDTTDRVMGETVEFRRVLIEERSGALPYFDGSTTNDRGIAYAWEGTVGASSSTARCSMLEVRRNWVPNPSMDNTIAGWSVNVSSNAVQSLDTAGYVRPGSYRVDVDAAATFDNLDLQHWNGSATGLIAVTPGEVITFQARAKRSTAGSLTAKIRWRNESISEVAAQSNGTVMSVAADTWVLATVTATVPANVTRAHLGVNFPHTRGSTGSYWVDDAMLEKLPAVLPYFDGYYSPDPDLTNGWTGTEGASISVLYGPQLVSVGGGFNNRSLVYRSLSQGGVAVFATVPTDGTNGASYASTVYPFVAGRQYTVLGKVRVTAPVTFGTDVNARLRIFVPNVVGGSAATTTSSNTPGVYDHRITFTATTSTTDVRLTNGASPGGGVVTWSDFAIVEGQYFGPMFDGDTVDTTGAAYNWEGTPHGSASALKASVIETRRNLTQSPRGVLNSTNGASFETNDSNPLTNVAGFGETSTTAVRWSNTAGSTSSRRIGIRNATALASNTNYTVLFKVRSTEPITLNTYLRPTTTTQTDQALVGAFNIPANVITEVKGSVTTNSGAYSSTSGGMSLIWTPSGDTTATVDITEIVIEMGVNPTPKYFDGSYSSDPDLIPSWTGAENESASILSGVVSAGWRSPGLSYAYGIQSYTPAGKSALRIIPAGSGNDSFVDMTNPPLQNGRTYTFLAKFRLPTIQTGTIRSVMPRSIMIIQNNNPYVVAQGTNTTGDQVIRGTITTPTTGTLQFLRLYDGTSLGNGDAYFEDFAIIAGVYTGPYLDGDMPNTVWRGTPHNSTSVGYPKL